MDNTQICAIIKLFEKQNKAGELKHMKTMMKYELIINEALRSALNNDIPDDEINEFISFFGKHTNSDRIYIFEDDIRNHTTNNTYEWCAEGIIPQIDELQNVDMEIIDWWYETFKNGKSVIISDLEEIKETHRLSYNILSKQNIHNLVVTPLYYKGEISGFFGVDNPAETDYETLTVFLDMIGMILISLMKIRNSFRKSNYEAKINSYASLAAIYSSMHLIDLKTETFQVIKSPEYINRNCADVDMDNFPKQIRNVMSKLSTEKYFDNVMEFTDITTLESRMKNVNTIADEFLGSVHGWCRERFIKVDNDENGNLWHVLYCIEIIDEEKRRENRLIYLSETDLMTGISNRGSGERKISELLSNRVGGMLVLIDCDKFKSINDTYGHHVGDSVIVAIAEALQKLCKEDDIVMRLGGDEFAMFIPEIVDKSHANDFFKRIFNNIDEIEISEMGDRKIYVSLGAAICLSGEETSFDQLYRKMDIAMYESKKQDGYCATIYSN